MMKNILDYFEATVKKYRDKKAVEDELCEITWQELQTKAKVIGTALCHRFSGNQPVVIIAEKSVKTLATMLGVIYAGGFYVMVDPRQPMSRIEDILATLDPAIIIADDNKFCGEKRVYLEKLCLFGDLNNQPMDDILLEKVRKNSNENDLLYGIFTSGSTGKPKCIVVSHKAVIDFIGHFITAFNFSEKDVVGNQAPFDFDVSVKDIYSCLMTGARLVIIPTKLFSTPPQLLDYICDRQVNSLVWAVSALTLVSCLKGLNYKVPTQVKRVMFSGEVMPIKQLNLWLEALPEADFVNLYGPSEITCNCLYFRVNRHFEEDESLPLGTAFEGRKVMLFDEAGCQINSFDTIGEIVVTGESLAREYYNDSIETAKSFKCITIDGKNARCYFTGDLAYFDKNGQLFFFGRKDFQVKHMGHRIELEEIEQALNALPGVEKSCCFMNKKRNRLVGFYYGSIPENEIKADLKEKLPTYMIPQTIVKVDEMPLNKNGKTDRKYFMNRKEVAG